MEILWLGAAYLTGMIASRLSFPPLVGYLCAGYALNALHVATLPSLHHLADIGIELMLFSVGLKLKPKSLLRREVMSVGGLHLVLMAAISALVYYWLEGLVTGGLVLGLSLAFSSTVLAIKVLEDNGELSTLHGRDVLSILILQDIVAIALLAYAEGKQPTPWAMALLLIPLLKPLAHRVLSASRSSELKLLLGMLLALSGGVLAKSLGISADIGALLMGIMLANHPKTDELSNRLWSLKELFLVAFFLQIGLSDLPSRHELLHALQVLALLPLQGVMFFVLFVLVGFRARTAFVSTLALTTYSEFALITTRAVVDAQLLAPAWSTTISLAVAGSLAIAAPLNRFSHRLFTWAEPVLVKFEKKSPHPDRLPDSFGVAEWLIIGMGRTGVAAYQALIEQEKRVVGMDADPAVLQSLLAEGRRVVYADAEDSELWASLPLERVKGIIVTVPSQEVRVTAISQLRKRGFEGLIGAIGYHPEECRQLQRHGASFVVQPLVEAGNQLAKHLLMPDQR